MFGTLLEAHFETDHVKFLLSHISRPDMATEVVVKFLNNIKLTRTLGVE
jgi:hypothetical protein